MLAVQVLVDERESAQPVAFFLRQEAHRGLVEVERALNLAPAGIEHCAPVLEALADQAPGRNGGDRPIPVLHLHRM
jgi:hypothetical protein